MKVKLANNNNAKILSAKQSQLSSLSSSTIKFSSKNTYEIEVKNSTLSVHLNNVNKKKHKEKPASKTKGSSEKLQSKKKIKPSVDIVKNDRKIKVNRKYQKSCDFQKQKISHKITNSNGPISYRQYCLIEDSFVPITSVNQENKLSEMLKSTADTGFFSQDFNRSTFRNIFPFKLKQTNISEKLKKQTDQRLTQKFSSKKQLQSPKISKRQIKAQDIPFYSQIGVQYSERFQSKPILNIQNIEQIEPQPIQPIQQKTNQIQVQTEQQVKTEPLLQKQAKQDNKEQNCQGQNTFVLQKSNIQQESLSDLLLKLQFKHLPNQKSFDSLSKNQKEHYAGLLSSLISKLAISPRVSNTTQQSVKGQVIQAFVMPDQKLKIKYEKLEVQIYKRQCYQMNWAERPYSFFQNFPQFVDTSLINITSFVFNLFSYIDLNYSEQFFYMVKCYYGSTYRAQFNRISKKLPLKPNDIKVLDSNLFQDFCQQSFQSVNQYEKTHMKAIFDCINQCLDCYRPYYQHDGEPFPWSVKMYNNVCEYSFDQNSLEIIFSEVKDTIQGYCSNLCGILVEQKYLQKVDEINPLTLKRTERESKLMALSINQKSDQHHQMDSEATSIFLEISDLIYNELILQALVTEPMASQFFDVQEQE